jgi:hypothetical protein
MTMTGVLNVGDEVFDGTNHPSSATVVADKFAGAALYLGTPASALGKDVTADQYSDYVSAGLFMILMYENLATDINSGAAGGAAHAQDFWNDAVAKGTGGYWPAECCIDEHLAADQLSAAAAYVAGFHNQLRALGWRGMVGVYGFPEVTAYVAAHAPVDFYHGCGSQSAQPSGLIHLWQDNNTSATVGGAKDDVNHCWKPLSVNGASTPPVIVPAPPAPSGGSSGKLPAGTVLRPGSTGNAVRILQTALNVQYPLYSKLTVDGDYGPKTEAVVKTFQSRAHLSVDGIAGPQTLGALHLL